MGHRLGIELAVVQLPALGLNVTLRRLDGAELKWNAVRIRRAVGD
jgi:hypothetical protein